MTLPILSYWAGEPYRAHAQALSASCEAQGHVCRMFELPDAGSWIRNCALKATVIHSFLQKTSEPFLFLDADARVVAPLDDILTIPGDMVVHQFRGDWVCSGTILVRPTQATKNVVTWWRTLCDENPEVWDSDHLEQAFVDIPCDICALGPEWCWINGLSHRYYPDISPKIIHLNRGEK